jgi:dTDP-4-dehydrorhamnose 3,5-epimerase
MIEGISITDLKIIPNAKGDIFHALKSNEISFSTFGEAYFTTIKKGCIKGWKKHNSMVSNLIVPHGKIKFVFIDDRNDSLTRTQIDIYELSLSNYKRITINPNIWFAFEGLDEYNLLLNISNILHDPAESENIDLENNMFSYSEIVKK